MLANTAIVSATVSWRPDRNNVLWIEIFFSFVSSTAYSIKAYLVWATIESSIIVSVKCNWKLDCLRFCGYINDIIKLITNIAQNQFLIQIVYVFQHISEKELIETKRLTIFVL